jgi:MFS transporter, LPLT family, lysophospholipid transporter
MNSRRNFPLLLSGQFLTAFGDNFLLASILAPLTFLKNEGLITEQAVGAANMKFNVVCFLPFILLAPLSGFLNDRMPKTTWLLGGNLIRALGAAIGLVGVAVFTANHDAAMLWQLVGYTVVSIGACFHSPAKYGILPEIVPAGRLVRANGLVQMLSLTAVLLGLGGGAVLYDQTRSLVICLSTAIGFYLLAAILGGMMSRTGCNPEARLNQSLRVFWKHLAGLVSHPRVARLLIGSSLFWMTGAFLRSNLQAWGISVLARAGFKPEQITNQRIALFQVCLVVGITLGSVLAGRIHRVSELGRQWLYGLGVAGGAAFLGLMTGAGGLVLIAAGLVFTGMMAGLLIVPISAALQHETDQTALGKTIAVQNVIDNAGMLAGAVLLGLMVNAGWSAHQNFLGFAAVIAVLTLGVRLWIRLVPAPMPSSTS